MKAATFFSHVWWPHRVFAVCCDGNVKMIQLLQQMQKVKQSKEKKRRRSEITGITYSVRKLMLAIAG